MLILVIPIAIGLSAVLFEVLIIDSLVTNRYNKRDVLTFDRKWVGWCLSQQEPISPLDNFTHFHSNGREPLVHKTFALCTDPRRESKQEAQ